MPGFYHPQVVHFAIALLVVGALFRFISLTGRLSWSGPAALTLLLAGTAASVFAVRSGTQAHGPVERIPGARDVVVEHEEWGERTRNVFLAVAAIELLALWLARRGTALSPSGVGVGPHATNRKEKLAHAASSILCAVGLFCLYEAGEHGGEIVYTYAGGPGIRSGQVEDVKRLLLAGLYHQALRDREAGQSSAAARLFDEMGTRFPEDLSIQMLAAESFLLDRKDPESARRALERIAVPRDNERLAVRYGFLKVDIMAAAGDDAGARAALEGLAKDFPANRRVKDRLDKLGR